ncbi:MAG TPA: caspase family protein [Dermatophilaceae bacterium]|nr:caspase family protein [Dermatophilaceae bacterium]
MGATTYALLVGIDAYQPPVGRLRGCVSDIDALAELLRHRAEHPDRLKIRMLRDAEATRAGVIAAFQSHLGQAGPSDTALFAYSGHGAQAPAPPQMWGTDPDRLLETLVLYDSRQPGGWDLADKELAALLRVAAAGGAHVLVVLDCCHSGSGTREAMVEGLLPRLAPPDDRVRPFDTFLLGEATTRGAVSVDQPAAPHVLLAACRPGELAKEVTDDGRPHGAFSSALHRALREAGGVVTYRDLHRWASAAVRNRVEDQSPQLEVTAVGDLDRPFLGGALRPCPPYYTVTRDDVLGWVLDGGAVHGIPAESAGETTELSVFALGTQTAQLVSEAVATARVVDVLPDRSTVVLTPALSPEYAYRAVVTSIPLPPMTVRLLGDEALVAPLRDALNAAEATLVAQVTGDGEGELVVTVSDRGAQIARPGGPPDRAVAMTGPQWVAGTVATVQHIARWMRLARLRNPSTALPSGAVTVELSTPAGRRSDSALEVSYSGDQQPPFTVTLTNTTDRLLWCALVDLTESYGVYTDAFPAGSAELAPGLPVAVPLFGEVPDAALVKGIRSLTDQLKVIVSTSEFDPRSLQQDELDVSAPAVATRSLPTLPSLPSMPTSTLERLVQRVTTRRVGPRPAANERISDWTVIDTFVTVRRPAR